MNGKFSERMKVVLEYVNEEALRLGDEKIGVEHLILGIIREGGGTAVRTLNTLGLEMSDLRKIIEEVISVKENKTLGKAEELKLAKNYVKRGDWDHERLKKVETLPLLYSTCPNPPNHFTNPSL